MLAAFLGTGIILDFFQTNINTINKINTILLWIQFLNITDKGLTIDWQQSFIILTEISSCPWALLTFRCLMIFNISTLQFQIIVPPRLLIFGLFIGSPSFLFGSPPLLPPLINFPDFVLQIFQTLLKPIVLFTKL